MDATMVATFFALIKSFKNKNAKVVTIWLEEVAEVDQDVRSQIPQRLLGIAPTTREEF